MKRFTYLYKPKNLGEFEKLVLMFKLYKFNSLNELTTYFKTIEKYSTENYYRIDNHNSTTYIYTYQGWGKGKVGWHHRDNEVISIGTIRICNNLSEFSKKLKECRL